jgi:hypothetical protein
MKVYFIDRTGASPRASLVNVSRPTEINIKKPGATRPHLVIKIGRLPGWLNERLPWALARKVMSVTAHATNLALGTILAEKDAAPA